jgi:ribonuclease HepT-like protein
MTLADGGHMVADLGLRSRHFSSGVPGRSRCDVPSMCPRRTVSCQQTASRVPPWHQLTGTACRLLEPSVLAKRGWLLIERSAGRDESEAIGSRSWLPMSPWQTGLPGNDVLPARLRNRIVHGYWSVDLGVLHTTASNSFPASRANCARSSARSRTTLEDVAWLLPRAWDPVSPCRRC